MNQEQKKYAINRINSIASQKKAEAKEKFTTKAVELTFEEKFELVSKGKVKVLADKSKHWNDKFEFDFSKYESDQKFDSKSYEAIESKLNSLVTSITDKLMLGTDANEALAMFDQIANFKI